MSYFSTKGRCKFKITMRLLIMAKLFPVLSNVSNYIVYQGIWLCLRLKTFITVNLTYSLMIGIFPELSDKLLSKYNENIIGTYLFYVRYVSEIVVQKDYLKQLSVPYIEQKISLFALDNLQAVELFNLV